MEPPFLDLHAATWVARDRYELRPDARRFENWETYYAGKIALGVAVDYALAWGLPAIRERVYGLALRLRERLAALPGVTVRDKGAERCGIVTFTAAGCAAALIRQVLLAQAINVSVSSYAGTRLDMEDRKLPGVVRASVHYYNSEEEIERFCAALEPPAARYSRGLSVMASYQAVALSPVSSVSVITATPTSRVGSPPKSRR